MKLKDMRAGSLVLVAAGLLVPYWANAESLDNGSSGQQMNQPKSTMEKQAVDMTGGKQGIPGKYDVVPVRQGELVDEKGGSLDQLVKNKQGETLGTIIKLLKDVKTGKVEYAVLELAETKYQVPLQWSQFKREGGNLTLTASKKELNPSVSSIYTKDMSPDLSQYMDQINKVRSEPKPKGEDPASGGLPMDSVGGFGPSLSLPPGPAPGYEGDDRPKREK